MKKILLMMLAVLMCLSVFSGCANEPTAPDPMPGGTFKSSNFPAEPPHLEVSDGISTIQAWRGTCSWYVENEDGTGSGICADSSHPLECKDSISALKVTKKTTIALNFVEYPSSITVRRYKLNASDYDSYDEITLNGNLLEVKSGDYLYEVITSWSGQKYNGTAYYAFKTEK